MSNPLERVHDKVGRMPDAEVAVLAGVSVDEVKLFRREHGIAPFLRPPPSFASAAKGAPPSRERASLSAETPPSHPLAAFHDRLGKVADQVIADEAGVPRTAVGDYRRKVGIPAYDGFRHQPRKTPEHVEGPAPGRRSSIDPYVHLLGTVPDSEIAAMAGVTREAVTKLRARRGIPGFGTAAPVNQSPGPSVVVEAPAPAEVPPPSRRASKLDAFRDIVGVLSDAEVAARSGVSAEGVRMFRKRNGIPAARPTFVPPPETVRPEPAAPTLEEAPTQPPPAGVPSEPQPEETQAAPPLPVEAPPPLPLEPIPQLATTHFAFAVVAVRGDEARKFVSVGADIGEALAQAQAALAARSDGPWRVRSIRDLVEALVAPTVFASGRSASPLPIAQAPEARGPEAAPVPPTSVREPRAAAPASQPPRQEEGRVYTGADLLACRQRLGLSQKQLGERIGVSQSVLSILERRSDTPLAPHLQRALAGVIVAAQ
ncbi:MAG: helix-turn-helix domain-containing protein [Myxococcota bacterium]